MNYSQIHADVDLKAIAHNVRELIRFIDKKSSLMAVVKSNGYGHGAVRVAQTAVENGAAYIGVARLDEAVILREAGISAPILIFGHTAPYHAGTLSDLDLTQTACSLDFATELSQEAAQFGKKVKVHLKFDTGMGRLGILHEYYHSDARKIHPSEELLKGIHLIEKLPGLELEGVYTHFSASDNLENTHTRQQFDLFRECIELASDHNISCLHAANGGAIVNFPETHLDMVRAGSLIYGLCPAELENDNLNLIPAMSLKTKVVQLKKIPAGFKLGYDCTWKSGKPTTIATVAIGYGDGFSRDFSNNGTMLVRGQSAEIVGMICMDMTMLDVGHIKDIQVGDEVVVFGNQNKTCLPAADIAQTINTIPEEIIVGLTARVPRIYGTRK